MTAATTPMDGIGLVRNTVACWRWQMKGLWVWWTQSFDPLSTNTACPPVSFFLVNIAYKSPNPTGKVIFENLHFVYVALHRDIQCGSRA